jgi:sugar lactone lactonase YvrE
MSTHLRTARDRADGSGSTHITKARSRPRIGAATTPRIALVCVLLALLLLALDFKVGQRVQELYGPSALALRPDGTQAWLAVDDEIWSFDAGGRRGKRARLADIGLAGRPYSLDWHPGAGLLAMRLDNESTIHLLDPATLLPAGTITLQWPPELVEHASRAVHLAFAEDGRIAASTGGGHAVALFGRDGRFLARTALGTYRFTNGLWWSGDALWTTDTNGLQLKRLDGRTLALQQSVDVPAPRGTRYLGLARQHPPQATDVNEPLPLATVIRFGNDRIVGVVADILPGGGELLFSQTDRMEPRDLGWLGRDLLVVDGQSRSVLRWNVAHEPLPPFGDTESRRELQDAAQMQQRLKWLHQALVAAAIGGVVAAITLVWHARRGSRSRRRVAATPHWWAVLASALLPGLGQWMRGRNAMALAWFLVWSVYTLSISVPVLWNLLGPRSDVSVQYAADVLAVQLLITAFAALEAARR